MFDTNDARIIVTKILLVFSNYVVVDTAVLGHEILVPSI